MNNKNRKIQKYYGDSTQYSENKRTNMKISYKSKNVKKSKTPAQDRLQKIPKLLTSNPDEYKKLLIDNFVAAYEPVKRHLQSVIVARKSVVDNIRVMINSESQSRNVFSSIENTIANYSTKSEKNVEKKDVNKNTVTKLKDDLVKIAPKNEEYLSVRKGLLDHTSGASLSSKDPNKTPLNVSLVVKNLPIDSKSSQKAITAACEQRGSSEEKKVSQSDNPFRRKETENLLNIKIREIGSPFRRNDSAKHRPVAHSIMKMSNKSKDVKKFKPKTAAQDRLQKSSRNNDHQLKLIVNDIRNNKTKHDLHRIGTIKTLDINNNNSNNTTTTTTTTTTTIKKQSFSEDKIREIFPNMFQSNESSALQLKTQLLGSNSNNIDSKQLDLMTEDISSGSLNITNEQLNTTTEDICSESSRLDVTCEQLDAMTLDTLTESSYIVPDTNVFIHSLASIKSIIDEDPNSNPPNILIPFVVLQELDQLKHRVSNNLISWNSSRAISYIYDQLKSKNHRLRGQKATKDKYHIINVTSPDDRILNCCLQLKNQLKDAILLTDDKNLSIKALLNGIKTITSKKCLKMF